MWCVYAMENYSVIKKNEFIPFAGKWMELEMNLWNEISQAQRAKFPMFSLTCVS
jgi:hypothetical protein